MINELNYNEAPVLKVTKYVYYTHTESESVRHLALTGNEIAKTAEVHVSESDFNLDFVKSIVPKGVPFKVFDTPVERNPEDAMFFYLDYTNNDGVGEFEEPVL